MQLVLFVNVIYWRKARQYQINYIWKFDWIWITTGKRSWVIFQNGKGFTEIQLVYLIDISEDNYKIVSDRLKQIL